MESGMCREDEALASPVGAGLTAAAPPAALIGVDASRAPDTG